MKAGNRFLLSGLFLFLTVFSCQDAVVDQGSDTATVRFITGNGTTLYFTMTLDSVPAALGLLPESPAQSGYGFAGWNTRLDGTGTAFAADSVVRDSMDVYATWTANSFTVTFEADTADTPPDPASIAVTRPATTVGTLPSAPVRTGYDFAGWYTGEDKTGNPFLATSPVSEDVTVHAGWTAHAWTVSFDSGLATTPASPDTMEVASPATTVQALPSAPVRSGYTFAGWYTEEDMGGERFLATTTVTSGITVHAGWIPRTTISATVSFPVTEDPVIVDDGLTVSRGDSLSFEVANHSLARYQWFLDGASTGSNTWYLDVDTTGLWAGVHYLMVKTTTAAGNSTSSSCRFTVEN